MTVMVRTGTPSGTQMRLPDSVDTVEKCLAWCLEMMWDLYGNTDFYPVQNAEPVKRVQKNSFRAGNGSKTSLFSVYLTVDPDFGIDGESKVWNATEEIGTATASNNYNS